MKRVKRWRYYCDYCGKGSGSGGHIAKHERGCTANPNRECGICRTTNNTQADMDVLIAALREDAQATDGSSLYMNSTPIPRLRDRASGCPACIVAAIRQSGLQKYQESGHSHSFDFDYKKEATSYWYDYNAEQPENWAY